MNIDAKILKNTLTIPEANKKDCTPRQSEIYPRNVILFQYMKINQ